MSTHFCNNPVCENEATHILTQGGQRAAWCEYHLESVFDPKGGQYAINAIEVGK